MLSELAKKWGTDKYFFYAPFYEELLAGKQVNKLLEIGIGSQEVMSESIARAGWTEYQPGASLRMWAEYLPEAEIFALDNNRNILINEGRIHSFYCNQAIPYTYPFSQLGKDFDLIVDDGSHDSKHQQIAMYLLIPLLAEGGIYITEDVTQPFETPYPAEFVTFDNMFGKASIYVVRR